MLVTAADRAGVQSGLSATSATKGDSAATEHAVSVRRDASVFSASRASGDIQQVVIALPECSPGGWAGGEGRGQGEERVARERATRIGRAGSSRSVSW